MALSGGAQNGTWFTEQATGRTPVILFQAGRWGIFGKEPGADDQFFLFSKAGRIFLNLWA